MQCTNNLKQVGLAVHNFHDAMKGIPPASVGYIPDALGPGHNPNASFWVLILPYIEQTALYDTIKTKTNNFTIIMNNTLFWNPLLPEEKSQFTSWPFKCPSRRAKATPFGDGTDNPANQGGLYGPQGDYAFGQGRNVNHWALWLSNYHPTAADHVTAQRGPIRGAIWGGSNASTWTPRDNMSYWTDGTSNQFVVGEKYIPARYVGTCELIVDTPSRWKVTDCSQLVTGDWNTMSSARSIHGYFARGVDAGVFTSSFGNESDVNVPQWGSNHTGTVNFLFGDGSVQSISITTPAGPLAASQAAFDAKDFSNSILARLGHVSDGNPVSIP